MSGRKTFGSNRNDFRLNRIVKQSPFKNLWELHNNRLDSVHESSTLSRIGSSRAVRVAVATKESGDNSHLPPDPSGVVEVVFVIGELPDAVVDGHAALSGRQVLLRHLHPAQRAHGETLTETT